MVERAADLANLVEVERVFRVGLLRRLDVLVGEGRVFGVAEVERLGYLLVLGSLRRLGERVLL